MKDNPKNQFTPPRDQHDAEWGSEQSGRFRSTHLQPTNRQISRLKLRTPKRKQPHNTMPSLINTSNPSQQSQAYSSSSTSNSRAPSPIHPPYSPITPTLSSARLAPTSNNAPPPPARQTYTHTSQTPQISVPQPPLQPINFDENPDVLALKSAASILQMQARNAAKDIQALQRLKEKAGKDPEGFIKALKEGKIRTKADPLFEPGQDDDDEDEDEEDKMDGVVKNKANGAGKAEEKWEMLPTQQNIVRCPPLNWNQYAIVGEPLDKLHKDQVERPVEGMPQRVGANGVLVPGGEGTRRLADMGVAAPYQPGRDKIEKMGTRKGGKR